jgi:hypothetical protein
MPKVVWSHNNALSRATNFSPLRLLFGAEAVTLEEIEHKSMRMVSKAMFCPSEAKGKDLLESDRLKAIVNLQKYQTEIKA